MEGPFCTPGSGGVWVPRGSADEEATLIREAGAGDIDAIVDLWLAASHEAHCFIPYEFWSSQADDMRDVYLPNSDTYVVCDDPGTVLGFVSISGGHVAALFVDPAHQCRSVGSALVEYAQSLHGSLTLAVYARNVRAASFYRRHGFAVVCDRVDERTGEPETIMEWSGNVEDESEGRYSLTSRD